MTDEPNPGAPAPGATVTLRELTQETYGPILRLKVAPEQERYVASNAISIAQAYFHPQAWFRGIYADDVAIGFVMIEDDPESREYFLWRFMIDRQFQGMGFGRRALELVVDYVRSRPGARELGTSYVPGEGSPGPFYAKFGFRETGEIDNGERVLTLPLE